MTIVPSKIERVMGKKLAKSLLRGSVQEDKSLFSLGWYLAWSKHIPEATLDGDFTSEELRAIAWWMDNNFDPSR